jgi:hypothetical protein
MKAKESRQEEEEEEEEPAPCYWMILDQISTLLTVT